MTKPRGTLYAATGIAGLVMGLAVGWLLHGTPASGGGLRPTASASTSPSIQTGPEKKLLASFSGVLVRAGNLSAVIDIGTRKPELVRLSGIAWGQHRGSSIPIPPPKGTHVCALALITPSGLRSGVFEQAKVFGGYDCTAVSAGQAAPSF